MIQETLSTDYLYKVFIEKAGINTAENYWDSLVNIENVLPDSPSYYKQYLEYIDAFMRAGDKLYALSVFDKVHNYVEEEKKANKRNNNSGTWENRLSFINKLGKILYEHDFNIPLDFSVPDVSKMRNKINKPDLHKIDGMEILLSYIPHDKFVKLAVAGSYFFHPDLVEQIAKEIVNGQLSLKDARLADTTIIVPEKQNPQNKKIKKGSKEVVYTIDGEDFIVDVDTDGNAAVRKLINDRTGVTVAIGKPALIQNVIISHVWGKAFDPRYFTSLWNIVLIPAWANSLMDKIDPERGSLASMMQATFRKICYELYKNTFNNDNYKSKTRMTNTDTPQVDNIKDIVGPIADYMLQYIGAKQGKKGVVISKGKINDIK